MDNNTVNDEEISSVEEDGADVGSEDEEEAVAPTIPAAKSSKLKKRGVTSKKLYQDQLQSEVANRNEIQSLRYIIESNNNMQVLKGSVSNRRIVERVYTVNSALIQP